MARLTELERKLRLDKKGVVRDELLQQLRKGEEQILQQITPHGSEAILQETILLLQACRQSATVISTLWQRYHPFLYCDA